MMNPYGYPSGNRESMSTTTQTVDVQLGSELDTAEIKNGS
jgi:hypothetical protein